MLYICYRIFLAQYEQSFAVAYDYSYKVKVAVSVLFALYDEDDDESGGGSETYTYNVWEAVRTLWNSGAYVLVVIVGGENLPALELASRICELKIEREKFQHKHSFSLKCQSWRQIRVG